MWDMVLDVVVLLGTSLLLGGLCSRIRVSPLLGYLLAGMALGGPGSLQLVRSEAQIEAVSELGVSLLLFGLGLEFSLSRLRAMGGRALWAGILQVLATGLVGGLVVQLAGRSVPEGIAVGAMVALSSTAAVLRVLRERAEVDAPHGRDSLAILLVQDIAVVPLAVVVTLLGGQGSFGALALDVGKIVLAAAALIVLLYLLLHKLAQRVLGPLTLERNRELAILLAVVTGLFSSWAAHWAGISPALGAFVAGMFLASSPFATQVRADVSPLRVVLLTLFFSAAGMVADPLWMLAHLGLVLGVCALLVVGKTLVVWGVLQALGRPPGIAIAAGLCLAQIGEFAFVLGSIARDGGALSADLHRLLVSVTIVSLLFSAFLVPVAPRAGAALARLLLAGRHARGEALPLPPLRPDVVIIGFGPTGQMAAAPLVGRPEEVVVIDLNVEGARRAQEMGFHGFVGDATQSDVLEHAGVHSARAVILTIPHREAALTIFHKVRNVAPLAHVAVRSRYHRHVTGFHQAGADVVFGDEEEAGNSLGRHLEAWITANGSAPEDPAAEPAG